MFIDTVELCRPLSRESYLRRIPAVRYLESGKALTFHKPVTILVGENGTGKSTLIEGIAVAYGFNPEGGSVNFQFSTAKAHSELHQHVHLTKRNYAKDGFFLRAESFFNVASNIDELDRQPAVSPPIIQSYGGVSLHEQSHGESFLALVQQRFHGNGLYILDEPEAALSPMRLLTLLIEIDRLVKSGSQFIIATHSPLLMAYPDAEILELSHDGIRAQSMEQTEHYRVLESFFRDPQHMMNTLLDDAE